MKREDLILIGGGGHCQSCIDVIEEAKKFRIAGIIDLAKKVGQKVLGYPIIASDDKIGQLVKEYKNFFVTIGFVKDVKRRIEIYQQLKTLRAGLPVICSPYAVVSKHASVGDGTIIMHQAVINAQAVVGCNVIVNTSAVVEHGAQVGDHCHVSTGAIVNGEAMLGSESFIGSKAVIHQNCRVVSQTIIGAGAVVHKDIKEKGCYVGVPAVRIS